MRRHALEILVKILRNMNKTLETSVKIDTQALLEMQQLRLKASMRPESHLEEDGSSSRDIS
jgi:hypothetical protein